MEASAAPPEDWQRLSAWCIPHFVVSRVVKYFQAFVFGVPATFGVSRTNFAELAWQVPLGVAVWLTAWAVLQYLFTRYRVTHTAVELQQGALFRRRLNLSFDRIQNVSIAEPFYFRPLGMANLSVDSAGSQHDEVEVAALHIGRAEALRSHISVMRARSQQHLQSPDGHDLDTAPISDAALNEAAEAGSPGSTIGEKFFTRSLRDLVIYGLTNNRAFIAVAGILGLFWQFGISTNDVIEFLGIDFDLIVAGWSLVRFTIMVVLAFILAIGVLALLSVAVSIFSYYGFAMYRTGERLIVRRGLINKHETAVRKSRIQSVRLSQDWLDYLLDRRNIYLEQLTHAQHGQPQQIGRQVMVPSVRLHETHQVTDEVWSGVAVERCHFTPISPRWLKKYAIIVTLIHIAFVAFVYSLDRMHPAVTIGAVALWPFLMALVYMTWRRGGLAVDGDLIIARSGTIGVNYRVFSMSKLQDVAHVQTPFMRRRGVSTLVFMTAASRVAVPYLPGDFARRVVNYALQSVETGARSWM